MRNSLARGAVDSVLAPVSLVAFLVLYWPVWFVARCKRAIWSS